MKHTYSTKKSDIKREWKIIDLSKQALGRSVTQIVYWLMGKNKAYFSPNLDCGDYVVAINAKNLKVTGKKISQKKYIHHTGYPGGLRELALSQLMAKDPRKVVMNAAKHMLPENKHKQTRMRRLKVFVDNHHPYGDKIKSNQVV